MTRQTLALSAALVVGCSGGATRETAALIAAVDRYRHAESTSKPLEAQSVAGVFCSDAKVCRAKRACLAGINPTARALTLKDEVARRVADLEQKRLSTESLEAQALPGKLDDAERLLREGRVMMPDCEKQLTDLQLEYGR